MKPTRNIVKPTGYWKPKGNVWFKKNDDKKIGFKFNPQQGEFKSITFEDEETKEKYRQTFKSFKNKGINLGYDLEDI